MRFSEWLRREIENRLMTIQEFSTKSGISPACLHNYLSGRAIPVRGLFVARIANGLGISRDEVERRLRAA